MVIKSEIFDCLNLKNQTISFQTIRKKNAISEVRGLFAETGN